MITNKQVVPLVTLDDMMRDLIQQSRTVQGYGFFRPAELQSALGAWRKGLGKIPQSAWIPAFQAALESYDGGLFNPPFVRAVYQQRLSPAPPIRTEDEAAAILQTLAMEILTWEPSDARLNILRPIADWIHRHPRPYRSWEIKVLDAIKDTKN